jgi:hypothetical protein
MTHFTPADTLSALVKMCDEHKERYCQPPWVMTHSLFVRRQEPGVVQLNVPQSENQEVVKRVAGERP